jgi:prepilin-type N-terminal cleavage/methylation domain-containing protein
MNTLRPSGGVTLIELLTVVAIIGILTAVAIPQFIAYRQRGYDARATSDLRNAGAAEEAYFTGTGAYVTCSDDQCESVLPEFDLSPTVTITMVADNGAQPTFTGSASSSFGSRAFHYDAASGGVTD